MLRLGFMHLRRAIFVILLSICFGQAHAQVVGGVHAFEFLRLPNAPHISALGGINVASMDEDIAFAFQNPALMRPGLHNQLGLAYNNFYDGISIANLNYGYYCPKVNTAFLFGVQYLNYGNFTHTDNLGNEYGDFHAADYAISLGASKSYLERWRYGATLKFASSTLYDYSAKGLVCDVGVNYVDTGNLLDIGVVAKNMGFMLKEYTPGIHEPLPFDLQIGVSKQLKHVPLRLLMTIHHLYEWDIRYDNPADNTQTNLFGGNDTSKTSSGGSFADKLFRHFIFGAELVLGKRVVVSVSYNDLLRREMVVKDRTGLTGFSYGVGIYLNKFQVHFGHTNYSIAGGYNEIGITMALNKIMGVGKFGEKVHWNAEYPNW